MNRQQSLLAARGVTDADDRLIVADEPLAELQASCGGTIPGTLAVPELLDLVRQCRSTGLRIAREFAAFDGDETVSGFARIHPKAPDQGEGCEVLVENWLRVALSPRDTHDLAMQIDEIDRATAEITMRLDSAQRVQLLHVSASDAAEIEVEIARSPGKVWTDYIDMRGVAHHQPLHWRLLDGSQCGVPGSDREWRARILPIGNAQSAPRGFDVLLVADEPEPIRASAALAEEQAEQSRLFGSALAPVLRQPIARVIANAETIRARLAGPLREDYSEYASNIVAAGQHLSGMLDDLADLEVVEAPGFSTAKEPVDVADAARRAAGIMGVRAQDRAITLDLTQAQEAVDAIGEFRRVLQILINLIGNAIAYSPEGTTVRIVAKTDGNSHAFVSVVDEGPGIEPDQASRIFDKFERLGRDQDGGNDSGSGLGLYISKRLARAMGGDLEVVQDDRAGGSTGATFKLTIPTKA